MNFLKRKKEEVAKQEVETTFDKPIYIPETDIYEEEDHIFVIANIPGVDEKAIDISLDNKVLTFTATQQDHNMKGYEQIGISEPTGVFKRSFSIETDIDQDKITAEVKDGVLKIKLPKAEALKPHKITVKAG